MHLSDCRPAALVLAVLGAACSDSVQGGVQWSTYDSTGVEIIVNRGSPSRWRLEEKPVLELGAIDASGPTKFYRVRDIELLPNGEVVVANQGSEELRIFAEGGAVRASVGGKGHGPEEFDGLAMVESFADSLLTWDGGNQRFSVRRLDGTLLRTFKPDLVDGLLLPVDLMRRGGGASQPGILTITARYMSQLSGSGLVVDTALVSVYALDGSFVDSVGRVPHNARAVLRVGNRQTTLSAPYQVYAPVIADEKGFCHMFGSAPEIYCRDRSGLRRLIRAELPIRSVTEDHVDRWWEKAFESSSERRHSALRRIRDFMPFPEAFPAFDDLLRDDQGRLWVRRYRTPGEEQEERLVFEDGRWVGRLDTPVGLEIMDVQGQRIGSVWRNSLGIEFIRIHYFESK